VWTSDQFCYGSTAVPFVVFSFSWFSLVDMKMSDRFIWVHQLIPNLFSNKHTTMPPKKTKANKLRQNESHPENALHPTKLGFYLLA
jgi:hypothetical protein